MALAAVSLLSPDPCRAMQITLYDSTTNDRFASGYASAPVPNSDPNFIGAGLDFSGVAWRDAKPRKSFAFVSPQHYLVARHFGGADTLTAFDQSQSLSSRSQSSVENTNYGEILDESGIGDLSLGTLKTPFEQVARYPVLDLNDGSTSNSPGDYLGLSLLVYGHGGNGSLRSPRVGASSISSVTVSGQRHRFLSPSADIQLETNDSGSPAFSEWRNPDGTDELAVVGNHAAVTPTYNLHNFLGTSEVMESLNAFMNDDGRALRVVGNPSATWSGADNNDIRSDRAWGFGGPPNRTGRTSDDYVEFDPASASTFSIDVGGDYNLRGIYFLSSGTNPGAFSISGASALSLGRGGITNYDDDTQVFAAPLRLAHSQFWDAGPGGLSVENLDTNGFFLEIRALGGASVSGTISGSGGIALAAGELSLSGSSSYGGRTWAHAGRLRVDGDITSSQELLLGTAATVTGTGRLPAVSGAGIVSPGDSPGILTAASVEAIDGLDFDFEFTGTGEPAFADATASVNDLLRLTGAAPFPTAMTMTNRIRVFLNVDALLDGQVFEGGFFTDQPTDFLGSIDDAGFEIYVPDANGGITFEGRAYALYSGASTLTATTEPQDADFGAGTVSGRILRLSVDSPPAAPTGFIATALSTSEIDLAWTDNSANEDGFLLERRVSGGSYAEVATLAANATSFGDAGLVDGTFYEYRIRAFNDTGDSASTTVGGMTFTVIEDWRLNFFGTTANSGDAADGFDFDLDTLPNLLEFATGSDPTVFSPGPVDTSQLASNREISFPWRIDGGYDFAVGFSTDLTAGFTFYDSATLDAGSSPELEHAGTSAPVDGFETRSYRVRDSIDAAAVFLRLRVE